MKTLKTFCFGVALTFATTLAAQAENVTTYYFTADSPSDETFDVFIEIQGGTSGGLAIYIVQLGGLEAAGIDSNAISWAEGNLSNLSAPSFAARGFSPIIIQGPVGTNQFSAVNTQGRFEGAIFGVGQEAINIDAAVGLPNNETISLEPRALLGELTIPGASGLSDSDLETLFRPDAFLFSSAGDVNTIVNADSVGSVLQRIPEPTSILLAGLGLGLVGLVGTRRRGAVGTKGGQTRG